MSDLVTFSIVKLLFQMGKYRYFQLKIDICSQPCQNSVKIQSKCNQNAVKMQSKFSQNAVKMLSKLSQN